METQKTYVILSEAWYGVSAIKNTANLVNDVHFTVKSESDVQEARMTWERHTLGTSCHDMTYLQVFEDAFGLLADLGPEFLVELARFHNNLTVKDFTDILEKFGFKDATPREQRG